MPYIYQIDGAWLQGFFFGFSLMSVAAFLIIHFVKPGIKSFSASELRAALQEQGRPTLPEKTAKNAASSDL